MSDTRERAIRRPWRQLLVLLGLTGFAISQPVLSILGDEPTILAFYGIEGASLVVVAIAIGLIPPLVLWLGVRLASTVRPRAGQALFLTAAGALVTCFAIQVLKGLGLEQPALLLVVSLGLGFGFVVGLVRTEATATWASYTSPLPVAAMLFFLLASPASGLLRSVAEPEPTDAGRDATTAVVIVLDELPTRSLIDADGQIDRVRFPNLAAFADESTWYRHHTSLSPITATAVPSLLTGRRPSDGDAIHTAHPDNLFTLLAPTHDLEVMEAATKLCPYDSCAPASTEGDRTPARTGALLGQAADLWFDRIRLGPAPPLALDDFEEELEVAESDPSADSETGPSWMFAPTDQQIRAKSARADTFIDSFDASKGPALYYLHLLLPHQPWRFYPDGDVYTEFDALGMAMPADQRPVRLTWSPWVAAVTEQRHLLQLEYTDRILGQIMAALRDEGLYDDALITVVADHGASFELETGTRSLTPSNIDAIAYAPFLLKEPGQTVGVVDDSNTMGYDVLPTIADRLGIEVGFDVDGAPAGSQEIAARGAAKQIYDYDAVFTSLKSVGVLDFNDDEVFPQVAERWIGPLTDPDDPLSGLADRLHLDGVLGRRLDDLRPAPPEGTAEVDLLEQLESPPADAAPVGLVTGRAPGAPSRARVVLAVNGVVVAGSEVSTDSAGTDGRFSILLPQGVLRAQNDIRAALVVGTDVTELEVRPRP